MTALVLGGTGMLSGAVRHLLGSGQPVVSVARRTGALPPHPRLVEVAADWAQPARLAAAVRAVEDRRFDTALLWVHTEYRPSVYAALAPLLSKRARVVEVNGSAGRGPAADRLARELLGTPDRQLHRVLLGSRPDGAGGRRWLTHAEISRAALAALGHGPAPSGEQGRTQEVNMKVSKQSIVQFIRERGDDEHADKAERELPETLTLPQDEGLLAAFGVQADDVDDQGVWGDKSVN